MGVTPMKCPKCNENEISVGIYYRCLLCGCEFCETGEIVETDIQKQLREGRQSLYLGKGLFMSLECYKSAIKWPDEE